MRGWICLLVLVAACDPDGRVALRFERPEAAELDPLIDEVRELTLHATVDGVETFRSTRPFDEEVAFGELPLGDQVWFSLAGTSASGRVIAFGRSGAAVDVTADDPIEVAIPVRRPFSYVAGGAGVIALDGVRDDGYATVLTGGTVDAVATTPDGAAIVYVADGALGVLSTSTHLPDGEPVALEAAPVHDLAISPDGRWAVAVHGDPTPGVTVVELAPRRATFVATGATGRVAVTADTAWLIEAPLDNLFCQGASSVRAIPLDRPEDAADAIPLGEPAGDIAVDPSGRVLIVLPCDSKIVTPELDTVLEVPGASSVTVAAGRIWAMGHIDGEAAHLILASMALAGGDVERLDLPTLEERAVAPEFDLPGQGASIQATADLASAFDLAILPDGEHVAILVAAVYLTEEVGDAGFGIPILPAVTMITYEYQLVQLDTGLGAQRLRTSCTIEWEPGAVVDDFRCGQAPGQDVADTAFTPSSLTALYGSR